MRTPALLARALTVAALCTTVAAAPSLADPSAAAAPHPRGGDPVLAALHRDLGLDAEQARARLALDARAATVQGALQRRLGERFGGAYLSGGRLVVGVTRAGDAAQVRALGAVPRPVAVPESRLAAAVRRLDLAPAPVDVLAWYADVRSDAVVVETRGRPTAATRAFAARAAVPVLVRLVRRAAVPRPLAASHAVRAGDAWFGKDFRCSVGFAARTATGGRAFVTAGHCTAEGGRAYGADHATLGTMSGSTFGRTGDFGEVTVSGSWTLSGTVNHYGGAAVTLTGSSAAVVGAAVCRSGSTTGWHCGTITAKNQTVRYDGASAVSGLTRTTVCAEPGDSGGAFVSGSQAQGVTSGGSGDCSAGGVTYFQPVTEALRAYHLTLVTG